MELVDLDGLHGCGHSATDLGRVDEVPGPAEGVAALRRRVLPLVELRADFSGPRQEIDDADRGADDIDLPELDEAVRQLALGENSTVFHGYADTGMLGITECSSHQPIVFSDDMEQYPKVVAHAVDMLRRSDIGGPYGWPSGPRSTPASSRPTSTGGICCSTTCARSSTGPWSGRRACRAVSC